MKLSEKIKLYLSIIGVNKNQFKKEYKDPIDGIEYYINSEKNIFGMTLGIIKDGQNYYYLDI